MKQLFFTVLMAISCLNCIEYDEPVGPVVYDNGFRFSEIAVLPEILTESSGLEIASSNEFWSFNDSKGAAALYKFDTAGKLGQTLDISNASNEDWEDMTKDQEGNIYIGDFGNNDNERKDLVIYKIKNPDLKGGPSSVTAGAIKFRFPDQTAFPPPKSERFFDTEAVFSKGDHLYLLIRDRSKPFVGKTKLYRLPNTPGNYTATFLEEFETHADKEKGQITAADLSDDGSRLALLSKESIWLFQLGSSKSFFTDDFEHLDLPAGLGAEGIVFGDNCSVYLTNEAKKDRPAGLFRLEVCP